MWKKYWSKSEIPLNPHPVIHSAISPDFFGLHVAAIQTWCHLPSTIFKRRVYRKVNSDQLRFATMPTHHIEIIYKVRPFGAETPGHVKNTRPSEIFFDICNMAWSTMGCIFGFHGPLELDEVGFRWFQVGLPIFATQIGT